jgi:hypothetical protein
MIDLRDHRETGCDALPRAYCDAAGRLVDLHIVHRFL